MKSILFITVLVASLVARSESLPTVHDVMTQVCEGIVYSDEYGSSCFKNTEQMHEFIDEIQEEIFIEFSYPNI